MSPNIQRWMPLPFTQRVSQFTICTRCACRLLTTTSQPPQQPQSSFTIPQASSSNARLQALSKRPRPRTITAKPATKATQKTTTPKRTPKPPSEPDDTSTPSRPHWQIDKAALVAKLKGGKWAPTRRKLSPDSMEGIRALHQQYPEQATTPVLAKHFGVSPEAIRRILKSAWKPTAVEEEARRARWDRRGKEVWDRLVERGYKVPAKWRAMGVGRRESGGRKEGEGRMERGGKREEERGLGRSGGDEQVEAFDGEDGSMDEVDEFKIKSPREEREKRARDLWWERNIATISKLGEEPESSSRATG